MHSTAAEKNKQGESTHKMESCFNFVSYHSHAVLNQQMQQSRASLAFSVLSGFGLVLSARTHSHRQICCSSSADGLTARECRSPATKNRHVLKEFKPCTVLTLARHRCTESYSLSLSSHLLATNFKFKVYFQPFLKPVFRTTQHSCDLPMTAQLLNFKGKWTGTALYWKRTAHIKPRATFKPLKFSASYSYIPCFSAFSVSLFITQVLLYHISFLLLLPHEGHEGSK